MMVMFKCFFFFVGCEYKLKRETINNNNSPSAALPCFCSLIQGGALKSQAQAIHTTEAFLSPLRLRLIILRLETHENFVCHLPLSHRHDLKMNAVLWR